MTHPRLLVDQWGGWPVNWLLGVIHSEKGGKLHISASIETLITLCFSCVDQVIQIKIQ